MGKSGPETGKKGHAAKLRDSFNEKTNACLGKSIANKGIDKIRAMGVSMMHEDRTIYGASRNQSIEENQVADRYFKKPFSKNGILNKKAITFCIIILAIYNNNFTMILILYSLLRLLICDQIYTTQETQ